MKVAETIKVINQVGEIGETGGNNEPACAVRQGKRATAAVLGVVGTAGELERKSKQSRSWQQ